MQNIWDNWKLTERIISLVRRNHVTRNRDGNDYRELHVQGWVDTDRQYIEHLQPAGFCANAGAGTDVEAVTLDVEADPTHQIAILVSKAGGPKCKEGEVCVYSPDEPKNQIKVTPEGICLEANGDELIDILIEMANNLNPPQPAIVSRLAALKC